MELIIAEKPSVALSLGKVLGPINERMVISKEMGIWSAGVWTSGRAFRAGSL